MKALLITFDKYPDLDAGAVRTHMFGKMLLELGYDVHVISMGPTTKFDEIIESDGIKHISYRGVSQNKIIKAIYYLSFAQRLYFHLKQNHYDVIIHSQLDERSLSIIQAYGKKNNIPVIYDSVEWFSESQFSKGEKSRAYKRNNRYNTCLIKEPSSVIAISSYLENHFKSRGIKTIRIPVVMDTSAVKVEKKCYNEYITLFYAGSPGKKDYLKNVIDAIGLLSSEERKRIKFVILGCTSDQLVNICGVSKEVLDRVESSLDVKGRVPREQVIVEYSKADFSILIRPTDQRYAKAGFPTKFVESLCCSTPIICNITSDLGEYAIDKQNAIVLSGIDAADIAKNLKRIIELKPDEIDKMKNAARKTAETYFDYRRYIDSLNDLLK
jgi:glycosyltransferase involved in cell wall biosynthesis